MAVGENSQFLTQLLCFLRVYRSLRSTVDQILISLSSPQEASNKPSQEKLNPRILALWALIKLIYFPDNSWSISQNLIVSSLDADAIMFPAGENFTSWIWLYH